MAVAGRTRALIERALKQREAVGRAGVAAAEAARAERAEAEAALDGEIARERAFMGGRGGVPQYDTLIGTMDTAWRAAAAGRAAAARERTRQAEAVCDMARDVLAETARTAKGFDLLMERQDAERVRQAARRDPLAQVMVLPR